MDGDIVDGKKYSQLKAIERLNKTLKQEKDNLLKVIFIDSLASVKKELIYFNMSVLLFLLHYTTSDFESVAPIL